MQALDSAPRIYRYRPRLDRRRKKTIALLVGGAALITLAFGGMVAAGISRPLPALLISLSTMVAAAIGVQAARGSLDSLREPAEYRRALAHLKAGDRAAALAAVDRAVTAAPESFSPHTLRGLLLSESGDFEGSLAAYRIAIERRPESWIGHSGAGAALLNLGRLPDAVEALGRSLALGAGAPVPRYQLGLALFLRGEYAGAAEAFAEALALGLEAPNVELVARTLRAWALERTGSSSAAFAEKELARSLRDSREVGAFAERLRGANLSPVGRLAAWAVGVDASPEPPKV